MGISAAVLIVAALCGQGALGARGFRPGNKAPTPEVRLPFGALGIPGLSARFLSVGASMLTVNFVDAEHLLVTFGSRGLVPRTADDPVGDQDRLVVAELVELPSGKILSRTDWRLHDHSRYLWNLGDGRFLLRQQESLSTFAPLANLRAGHPWERVAFPHHRAGELREVEVAADNRLLILETAPRVPAMAGAESQNARTVNVTGSGELVDPKAGYIVVDLYRMSGKGTAEAPTEIRHEGYVRAAEAMRLPVDSDGFLRLRNAGRKGWDVSFQDFGGTSIPISAIGSSCPPLLQVVSSAQMLAFGCRGITGADSLTIMAYDFAGHEVWEEPIGSLTALPAFAYAPSAGRFAMSRQVPVPPPNPQAPATESSGPGQEMRVYQTQSGDLLLKLNLSPNFRTAENFDLSADGSRAVVVNGSEVVVYRLPELTKADREDLEDVRRARPPASTAVADLKLMVEDDSMPAPLETAAPAAQLANGTAADSRSGVEGAQAPQAATGTGGASANEQVSQGGGLRASEGTSGQATEGDGPTDQTRRKPPSLLNPGERPEFGGPPK